MSIPFNEEHLEAYQDEINRKREASLLERPAEEVARMRIIESVSAQLEQAKIPFVLWADPVTEPNKSGFIRFNRLDYMDGATLDERIDWLQRQSYFLLFPYMMEWISKLFGIKHAVYYDEKGTPLFGHDLTGEKVVINGAKSQE